ncbi:MAG: hypothetical protein ABSC63_04555 [Candidatus Binataceae bacterium]
MKGFGQVIIEARTKAAGLTQKEIAGASGAKAADRSIRPTSTPWSTLTAIRPRIT